MKINAAFPSAYLKAADLQGRKCVVTMRQITMEEIGGEHKPVLLFDGSDKGLILNKTNANIIAEMHGDETDDWVGRKIILYPARVEFSGKIVDAIRVELQQRALGMATQAPLGRPAMQTTSAAELMTPPALPVSAAQPNAPRTLASEAARLNGIGHPVSETSDFPGDRGIPIRGDEIPF